MKNWTEKMKNLEVGASFEAEKDSYISLNGTRQRFNTKFPSMKFSITVGGNLSNGKVTVKRIA